MGFQDFLGVNPWDALFTLANTLTIFLVARKYLFAPVMKMIQDRQAEIDGIYKDADEAKSQALSMQKEYREKLENAQADSERLVKEAVARGQAREEEILRQAGQEADALRQRATQDIAREKKQALNDAKDQISGIAMAIAEKVVGRELTEKDQSKLVDEFIAELGDGV